MIKTGTNVGSFFVGRDGYDSRQLKAERSVFLFLNFK